MLIVSPFLIHGFVFPSEFLPFYILAFALPAFSAF